MENINICEKVLDKKLDTYGSNNNDFIASSEITVTITLKEYRDLIKAEATATSRIEKANEDKYNRDSENTRLKEENAKLKAELYELHKTMDMDSEESEDDE